MVLKCQVCGHNCDSPSQLQQHVRTHLEVRVPAERSPTPRQSAPSAAERARHRRSPRELQPSAGVPELGSSSPGADGGSATPRGCSPGDGPTTELRIKEEPRSDGEGEEQRTDAAQNGGEEEEERDEEREEEQGGFGGGAEEAAKEGQRFTSSCGASKSPTSPVASAVKAEPTSPTPGSSPAHAGGAGTLLPGGAMFLPQYLFNPEAAILPQASEILAKMSEMVHSRLKQGQTVPQTNPAAFYPSGAVAPAATATPPHTGATCFECDITFNNINNFYAHKRLYCSSRHHGDAAAAAAASGSGPGSTREAAQGPAAPGATRGCAASPQAVSRAVSASPTDSDPPAGGGAPESQRLAEVKTETPTGRDGMSSSSEGEGGGGGRTSEGSQSPAGASVEESEDDPNRTFCEACNIRFSRHDNYTVHKRFYCASRHDPSNQRSAHVTKASAAAAFLPQPIRTRKRKKMYEIHMARTEALANAAAVAAAAAAAVAASAPSPSVLGLTVKREVSPSGARSSSPEGDGPIDLSKRPRLREAPRHGGAGVLPVLPLSDYHKCTACSISFNSIENYLAHKTYYCPATTLQPHTLEQLQRLKRSASTSPKTGPLPDRPDLLHPVEANAREQGASSSPQASAFPASKAASPSPRTPASAAPPGAGGGDESPGSPQVPCPYCPNRLLSCDLMEHFKTTHGLVVTVQSPQEAPAPAAGAPCRSPADGASSEARPLFPRGQLGGVNGQVGSGPASPASPLPNGNPTAGDASPSSSPRGAPSLTLSPVPETLGLPHLPAPAPAPAPTPPPAKGPVAVQNGSSRFCRLCNIRFSSLSTFIAHKKYYCSSHSAEHVK